MRAHAVCICTYVCVYVCVCVCATINAFAVPTVVMTSDVEAVHTSARVRALAHVRIVVHHAETAALAWRLAHRHLTTVAAPALVAHTGFIVAVPVPRTVPSAWVSVAVLPPKESVASALRSTTDSANGAVSMLVAAGVAHWDTAIDPSPLRRAHAALGEAG